MSASRTRRSAGSSGLVSEPLTAIASTSLAIAFSISPTTSSVEPCARPAEIVTSASGWRSASASAPAFCAM
jgi:hypothetical protein